MHHMSVSLVPNLGKTTRSSQSELTPWILTLFKTVRYFLIPLGLYNLNGDFKIFWITGYLVFFSLIPMIVIIRNNIIILLELQSTSKMKREKTAMVLFATVTVFLVCHAFRFVETGMIIWNPITKFQTEYCGTLNRYGVLLHNYFSKDK